MNERLPAITAREAVRALERAGFAVTASFSRPHAEERRAASRLEAWPPSSFETRSCGALLRMRAGMVRSLGKDP
jgi:hypothetical protein